jgi:hypothetical protein
MAVELKQRWAAHHACPSGQDDAGQQADGVRRWKLVSVEWGGQRHYALVPSSACGICTREHLLRVWPCSRRDADEAAQAPGA